MELPLRGGRAAEVAADEGSGPGVAGTGSRAGAVAGSTRIFSVGEAARAIASTVRADEQLRDLWVEGEVGRVTISSAGHAYFTLKDERAALQCVWFRDDRVRSPFQPQTGLRVVAHGRVDVYEAQGALQLYVDSIQPSGVGDLAIRFEQLKAKLAAEGLFASERKRALPPRPQVVAVVSSPTGAAWKDVCQVFARRWPLTRVVLVACQVQGEGSAESIVRALRRIEKHVANLASEGRATEAPVLTIVARGGGSMEDLWSFNDERVVRAIVAHALPVVSGVGHEVDVTLTDFAADVRAATPTAAAELVIPDRVEYASAIMRGAERMRVAGTRLLVAARRDLDAERRVLDRLNPAVRLAATRQLASDLLDRATRAVRQRIANASSGEARLVEALPNLASRLLGERRATLAEAAAALAVLGPQATLERGYAIVRKASDQSIVRDPAEVRAGSRLRVRVAHGEFPATVASEEERLDA
jgi:exodeoxyribonuclease VII large subunit